MSASWVTTPGSAIDSSKSLRKVSSSFARSCFNSRSFITSGEDGCLVGVLGVDHDPLADRDPPITRHAARGLLEERADAFSGISADDIRHDEDLP